MLGVLVLANLVDSDALTRTIAFLFVLVVWALQLAILRSESGVSRRQSGKEQTGAPRR